MTTINERMHLPECCEECEEKGYRSIEAYERKQATIIAAFIDVITGMMP